MQDLEGFLASIEELYRKANFNETEKFSMIQKATNNIPYLAVVAMYRNANSFEDLKIVFIDLETGLRIYP